MRLRYVGRLAAAAVVFGSILANAARYTLLLKDHYYGSDLRLYYAAAHIGLTQGWRNIYDPFLQSAAIEAIGGPYKPFLNPPPTAWLAVPLTALTYDTAYVVWTVVCVAALAGSVLLLAPTRRTALIGLSIAAALYPTLFALYLGQASILVLVAVAAAWRLHQTGHQVWSGVALSLMVVKPQMALLLPLALMVSGRLKLFAGWAIPTAVLAAASLATLGEHGVAQYLALAENPLPEDSVYTLSGLLGEDTTATTLKVLAGLIALAAAALNRRNAAKVFAAGLVGSALAAPYWHVQDFLAVMAAIGLLLIPEGGASPAPTNVAAAAAVFLAANPLWVGGAYKPAWLEVALWLAIEAAILVWLIKERAPATAGALRRASSSKPSQTSLYSASTTSPSPDSSPEPDSAPVPSPDPEPEAPAPAP
jgi:Glycosyltransferase family 87